MSVRFGRCMWMTGLLALFGAAADAGVIDTALPNLQTGSVTRHVFTVPGVIKNNNLETEFICTSLDTSPARIGVEIFAATGGAPLNNVNEGVGDGAVDLPVGGTVSIGTGNTAAVHEDEVITLGAGTVKNGSARIVSTSTRITCLSFVTDDLNDPPTGMVALKVIQKKKQAGD